MTREIINEIAKTKKINLDWYTHVIAHINENYTKVLITFGTLEVVGGSRYFCGQKHITIMVSALQRNEKPEWEYTTQGWERIEHLR